MNLSYIVTALLEDRTITVGGSISVPTLIGGITIADAHQIGGVIAVYVGILASSLVCIYTALKICRLMRDKAAKE